MMISIQCAHCRKRYNAPGSMAGKKVKCKHCGKVFAISADAIESTDQGDEDRAESRAPNTSSASAPTAPSPIRGPARSAPTTGGEPQELGHPSKGYATRLQRKGDAQEIGLAEESAPPINLRPSVPFDFPGAAAIDSFLPVILVLLGLGLTAMMAVQSNLTAVSWVGTLRMAIYITIYFAIVFPVCWLGIRWASQKLRFAMPPSAPGRAIGAFALSFGIAMAMWLAGQSAGMLITGTILGAIIACGAVWLLFRLQPQEITTACSATAGAFALSILLSYVCLVLVNMGIEAGAKSWTTNVLASSPIAPGLSWNVPLKEAPAPVAVATQPDNSIEPPATGPATQETETPATAPTTAPDSRPTTVAVDPPATMPATRIARVVDPPATQTVVTSATTRATVVATRPAAPPGLEPLPTSSPLVASAHALSAPVEFDSLMFCPGTAPVFATLTAGEKHDTVEVWNIHPLARKATGKFAKETSIPGNTYALAGNGDWVARIVTWPNNRISITSLADGKVFKELPLPPADNVIPQVFGFAANDTLMLHWTKGTQPTFEVLNVKQNIAQRVAYFMVDPFEATSGNPLLSPDGRMLAVAAEVKGEGGIDLYDATSLVRKGSVRTLPVGLAKWVKPAGMAFSPDSKLIAAFFEQRGRGLLLYFRVLDTKPVREHVYPALPVDQEVSDAVTAHKGRYLDWLDAQTWLLCGRVLIDVDSGKTLGSIDVPGTVRSQHVMDKETILLTVGNDAEKRLVLVKLKLEALATARKAARGPSATRP